MRCIKPLKAGYSSAGDLVYSRTGWSNELVGLDFPCRKCLPCLLNQAREKAIRCVHESRMCENSIFLTLTYDDVHLPGPRLQYLDVQLFMKSLREKISRGVTDKELKDKLYIPMMVTGEYGELNKRPHWHLLLFNYRPADLKKHYVTDRGDQVWVSEEISSLWKRGHCDFGSVTVESAGYVARYGAKALVHGSERSLYRPIHKTSCRRAIGRSWIEVHWRHALSNGYVVMPDGSRGKIPRYYLDWAKEHQPEAWLRYVTEVRPNVIVEANERQEKEELAWLEQWRDSLWSDIKGLPLAPSRVKHTILSRKFKQLQEKLKL